MKDNIRWIDFLPLAIFAWVPKMLGLIEPGGSWANAFYIGGTVALIMSIYLWYRGLQPDLIALAGYLFLIYGALGYLTNPLLLAPYGWFDESIIFVWIFLVGLVATMVSKGGFIQGPSTETHKNLLGSLALLGLSATALVLSYCLLEFGGFGTAIGAVLPTVALIYGRALIKEYFFRDQLT